MPVSHIFFPQKKGSEAASQFPISYIFSLSLPFKLVGTCSGSDCALIDRGENVGILVSCGVGGGGGVRTKNESPLPFFFLLCSYWKRKQIFFFFCWSVLISLSENKHLADCSKHWIFNMMPKKEERRGRGGNGTHRNFADERGGGKVANWHEGALHLLVVRCILLPVQQKKRGLFECVCVHPSSVS